MKRLWTMLISWSPQNSPVILNEPKSANRFGTRSGFGQSHEYLKINIRSLRMKANRCQLQGYKGVVVTARMLLLSGKASSGVMSISS